MHKQNVVDPYNGILFSSNKEWSSDTGHHMGEPWRHDAKGSKPDTKHHTLYDSIYVNYPGEANL